MSCMRNALCADHARNRIIASASGTSGMEVMGRDEKDNATMRRRKVDDGCMTNRKKT